MQLNAIYLKYLVFIFFRNARYFATILKNKLLHSRLYNVNQLLLRDWLEVISFATTIFRNQDIDFNKIKSDSLHLEIVSKISRKYFDYDR